MTNALASWNDGPAKQSILDFVARVTTDGSSDFVAPEARVAVFDNDGTLWCEKPLPIQADFLLRRIGAQAQQDPSLRDKQPWKAVYEKDHAWLSNAINKHYAGDDSDLNLMAGGLLKAYAGSSIEEFEQVATEFLRGNNNPKLGRPYLQTAFAPMVELLRYLEASGFTNYIASGGGRDFMRPITQELYGIPPERVIGSSVGLEWREDVDGGTVYHLPKLDIFDDGPEKVVRIWSRVGRRPILVGGNSNGDMPMMTFAGGPKLPALRLLVLHDDAEREADYTAGAEKVLERARERGWTVASVKNDWNTVFAE